MRTTRDEIVEDLNRLMAEEAEAFLRYFHMRFRLRGKGRRSAEKLFDEALKETLEHAEALAKRIQLLGHVPTLNIRLSLAGEAVGPEEALTEALEIEQQALDAYREFLPRVADDPALGEFIRKQIAVETDHVEEIREVIGDRAPLTLVNKPARS